MADKSAHIPEPLEFHPCDTPRGMEYYNLEMLTRDQQKRLNGHKTETLRDNQKYLYRNPEIRAVLQLIMRKILIERPSHDIETFIGKYFSENWQTINEEVEKYVASLPGKPEPPLSKLSLKDDKHVTLDDGKIDVTSIQFSVSSEDNLSRMIIKEIMEEMIEKVQELVQKRVKTSDSAEVIEEKKHSDAKSFEDDDELYFDLGLDFDLDFSAYHEDDDKELLKSFAS